MFRPSTFVSVLLGSLTIVGAAPVVEPPPAATPFRVSSKGDGLNRGPARELAHALARAGHDSAGIQKLRKRQNSRSSKFRDDDDDSTPDSLDVVSSVLIGAVLPSTAPISLSTRLPRKSATVSTTGTPIRSDASPASADVSNIANSATAAATASIQQSASGNLVAKATATEAAGQDQYIETLTIGSQAHELHVVFDTGSTDFWFYDPGYDETADQDYKTIPNEQFSIVYGDGTWANASSGRTSVNIGGITAPEMAVGVIESQADVDADMLASMERNKMQGYMGLAFTPVSAFAPIQQPSFFETVISSLSEPLFTVDLVDSGVGTYTFGQLLPSDAGSPVEWAPLNKAAGFGRWAVDSSQIYSKFGDDAMAPTLPANTNAVTIFDTGTTLILMEPALVEAYYAKMQETTPVYTDNDTGMKYFSCTANPPLLSFGYKGHQIPVNNLFAHMDTDGKYCTGSLQSNGDPGDHSKRQILGAMFFRSALVAFNAGNSSIGIADKASKSVMSSSVLGEATV